MLEEAYGKVAVRKARVCDGHVSVSDLCCELPSPLTNNESVECVHMLKPFRRFQQKQEYQLEAFTVLLTKI
jgi:hypothetical protein